MFVSVKQDLESTRHRDLWSMGEYFLLVAYCCFWNVHFKITHRRSRIWLDCNGSSNKRQIRERVFGPKGYCSRERISKLLAESQKIQNIPNQWKFNVIGHTEKRKKKKTQNSTECQPKPPEYLMLNPSPKVPERFSSLGKLFTCM